MELDIIGLLGACSYALDCVEAELTHVATKHGKRVAYMSVCTAQKMGITGDALQDLAACSLLHDNALTQYIYEEFHNDLTKNNTENIVPRKKRDLSDEMCKNFANLFAKIIDYKSEFTSRHSLGVAENAARLSRYLGDDEETVLKMYLAGALHDIGKAAIGNDILEKPGRLTDEEFSKMKNHAGYTYLILSQAEGMEDIRDWAALHHEKLDGTGYPFGKTADELNRQERIMACIDIYQALTESRPYKSGMTHEAACEILENMVQKGWIDGEITEQIKKCFA